jgi:voltage-gated potassium channel
MEQSIPARPNLKQRVFAIISDPHDENRASRVFNSAMLALISVNVLAVVLETEQVLYAHYAPFFHAFDAASVAIFTVEYVLRLWTCNLDPRYRSPVLGRLRFALTPLAIIDLVAILPFYLPMLAVDLRFVRSVRLFRLFRLFKLSRYSQSLNTLVGVLKAKKEELLVAVFSGAILLVIASSLVYLAERESQPEAFSSIPSAMWWGVVTLTTVGYGDVYPKTVFGKLIGGLIAVLGVGMFALPAGIIASGFAERIARKPRRTLICPHCGKEISEDDQ